MDSWQKGQPPAEMPSRERIAEYLDATTVVPSRADLVFVPGTRLSDPAAIAARLLIEHVAPSVLVTGGVNRATGENEAAALQRELLALGVSPATIFVEDTSANTLENVLRGWEVVASRFADRPLTSVVAVCKWMHSRRVLMTLKAHLPADVRYYACTYAPEGVTREAWVRDGEVSSQTAAVISNWQNIPAYLAKGDIREIERVADGGWA
ncbi:MAG: YdcF family protein [Nocardioides sp.]